MSAYSTLTISRKNAIRYLTSRMYESMSNKELEDLLDSHLRDRLYNAIVTNDESTEDDVVLS